MRIVEWRWKRERMREESEGPMPKKDWRLEERRRWSRKLREKRKTIVVEGGDEREGRSGKD
jgi:hypothetical protein